MDGRDVVVRKLRARLAKWERDIDDVVAAAELVSPSERETLSPRLRELLDRIETARIKVAKVERASPRTFEQCRNESRTAFRELRTAWDSALRRIAPLIGDGE